MTKAVGKVNDLQNAAPSEWWRRLADPECGTLSLNPLDQAQITDKARKRKNACRKNKSVGIFAYCVSFGCKLRSLTSM